MNVPTGTANMKALLSNQYIPTETKTWCVITGNMTGYCQCVQRAKFIQEPCSLRPLRYWLTVFGCSCSFITWAWLPVSRLVSVLIYSLVRLNDCDTKMQIILKEKYPQSRPWMSNNLLKRLFFTFKIKLFYSS